MKKGHQEYIAREQNKKEQLELVMYQDLKKRNKDTRDSSNLPSFLPFTIFPLLFELSLEISGFFFHAQFQLTGHL